MHGFWLWFTDKMQKNVGSYDVSVHWKEKKQLRKDAKRGLFRRYLAVVVTKDRCSAVISRCSYPAFGSLCCVFTWCMLFV